MKTFNDVYESEEFQDLNEFIYRIKNTLPFLSHELRYLEDENIKDFNEMKQMVKNELIEAIQKI